MGRVHSLLFISLLTLKNDSKDLGKFHKKPNKNKLLLNKPYNIFFFKLLLFFTHFVAISSTYRPLRINCVILKTHSCATVNTSNISSSSLVTYCVTQPKTSTDSHTSTINQIWRTIITATISKPPNIHHQPPPQQSHLHRHHHFILQFHKKRAKKDYFLLKNELPLQRNQIDNDVNTMNVQMW